jgi:hypothetical protein
LLHATVLAVPKNGETGALLNDGKLAEELADCVTLKQFDAI